MSFANRFQLNYKQLEIPSKILNNEFISSYLKILESQKFKKNRNISLFNNRVKTATYKTNTKKSFNDLKGVRVRSNYLMKKSNGLYETIETSSIEDKLSEKNHSPLYKFKNAQFSLKNLFITSNYETNTIFNSPKNVDYKKSKNLLSKKKYHSLKEINEEYKTINQKRLYSSKTPKIIFNNNKNLNTINNLTEKKDKIIFYNLKTSFKNLAIKRQYTEDIITDNLKDLLQVFDDQTVNNFNNKYHIKYKTNNPKKRNKITKIFEMLKKNNMKLKSMNDIEFNRVLFIKDGRNLNSYLVKKKNNNTIKKTSDVSIGTDDILLNRFINLKQKQKDKDKIKNKSLRIHTLNLVNVIK